MAKNQIIFEVHIGIEVLLGNAIHMHSCLH